MPARRWSSSCSTRATRPATHSIEIFKPTTTGYVASKFSYTADATAAGSKSGTNVSFLKTTISGVGQYNNSLGHAHGATLQDL